MHTGLNVDIRLATSDDSASLLAADAELFDYPVDPECTAEFLADPRHHIALAMCGCRVVGFASAIHYLHPDKAPHLFINEVAVLAEFRNQGIARGMVKLLCEHGRTLGCTEAWVATEPGNAAAHRTYSAAGGQAVEEKFVMFNFDLAAPLYEASGESVVMPGSARG
jgi:GNAT superfamily N-acetyltransferase